ncbi:glycosyltransferase [Colwellia hornerae]|uniref:Glycosyltransferase n=1 Tax=Colwellia hornerae TaxID=89402 RepID=A0A5C6QKL2_9GAMM|nr:glycosyltransferase [Colwellia hornerae]TWX54027.1 glycosyltransferase [Colwellia hornerae]TWX60802.1 glycosyltransferase [Colwellia hornerae]TWX69132.1 glycosyltransferase [Colwellia hornerae]
MNDVNVAVIMSVYKNDNFSQIKEAVDSIMLQTLHCHLFVVADGPVCPDVHDYFLTIAGKNNCLFSVYYFPRATNLGLAPSLNELIDYVLQSENKYLYIARMDADDICYPERLQKQVDYFLVHQVVDVLGTGCVEFSSTNESIYTKILPEKNKTLKKELIKRCPFVHPSVMFRINLFRDGVRYPTDTKFTEDYAFWVLLAVKGYEFGNVQEALIKFRFESDVLARRRGLKKANSEFSARWNAMNQLDCMSLENIFYSFAIWGLRVVPPSIANIAYKKLR